MPLGHSLIGRIGQRVSQTLKSPFLANAEFTGMNVPTPVTKLFMIADQVMAEGDNYISWVGVGNSPHLIQHDDLNMYDPLNDTRLYVPDRGRYKITVYIQLSWAGYAAWNAWDAHVHGDRPGLVSYGPHGTNISDSPVRRGRVDLIPTSLSTMATDTHGSIDVPHIELPDGVVTAVHYNPVHMPEDWYLTGSGAGDINLKLRYLVHGTSAGNIRWDRRVFKYDETVDDTDELIMLSNQASVAAPTVANDMDIVTVALSTVAGVARGDSIYVRVEADRNNAGDTNTDGASLYDAWLDYQLASQLNSEVRSGSGGAMGPSIKIERLNSAGAVVGATLDVFNFAPQVSTIRSFEAGDGIRINVNFPQMEMFTDSGGEDAPVIDTAMLLIERLGPEILSVRDRPAS